MITKIIIQVEVDGQYRVFGLTTPERVAELLKDNPGIADLVETTLRSEPPKDKQGN